MSTYIEIAQNITNLANYVKKGQLAFQDIPFEQMMDMVQKLYQEITGVGSYYAELYASLIMKGVEHNDREEVAAVMTMMAQHMGILTNSQLQINKFKTKNYYLRCRSSHLENCEKVRRWHEQNEAEGKIPFTGKGVVYSAITGDYDNIKDPKYVNPDLDYILFTNNPKIKSSVWQVRLVENPDNLDNVRLARRIKIMGHEYLPEYDYSIWVDGKLEIIGDLREYAREYRKEEPILCFTHYVNDCIYQEKDTCLALKKDAPDIMEKQMERYRGEGYPANNGLVESGIMVRDLKDERMQKVMETWWQEIISGSRRDQLSFNYSCWKNNLVYDTTDLFIYENKYVVLHAHNE